MYYFGDCQLCGIRLELVSGSGIHWGRNRMRQQDVPLGLVPTKQAGRGTCRLWVKEELQESIIVS